MSEYPIGNIWLKYRCLLLLQYYQIIVSLHKNITHKISHGISLDSILYPSIQNKRQILYLCLCSISASPLRLIQPLPKLCTHLGFLPATKLSIPDQRPLGSFPLIFPHHHWVLCPQSSIISQEGGIGPFFPNSSKPFYVFNPFYLDWWFPIMFLFCSSFHFGTVKTLRLKFMNKRIEIE